MTSELLLDHYKKLYKIIKKEKDETEKLLEEYKLLSTMQQDIITKQNKTLELLSNGVEQIVEGKSNER